jgi:uridine kinase
MKVQPIVDEILRRPGPVRLVAVDGPGGSGKSTFALRLAAAAGDAPIVHTDDFASADNPVDWWPRLLEQVIEPLSRGVAASYQRYDWGSRSLAEWHDVEPTPIVIVEGVSSERTEWLAKLSYVVWIDAPPDVRLRRGLDRDGEDAIELWKTWMAAEDEHYRNDPTRDRADLIVDGTS